MQIFVIITTNEQYIPNNYKNNSNSFTSYTGIVRDSNAAILVESDGSDLTGAASSVLVVAIIPWHRVIVIVVDVCAGLVIVIQRQIRMIRLYSVVEDRNDDTFTGVTFLPRRAKIHVVAIFGSTILQSRCSLILTVSFHNPSYSYFTQCEENYVRNKIFIRFRKKKWNILKFFLKSNIRFNDRHRSNQDTSRE